MYDLFEIMRVVAEALDASGIPYAVTGSVASSYHGRPRGSLDANFAITMRSTQAQTIGQALAHQFYVSQDALRDACQTFGMANVIHLATGLKVDLSVLKPTDFHRQVMARRRRVEFPSGAGPIAIWVVSPEDVVLMKLEWRKDTLSSKAARGCARSRSDRSEVTGLGVSAPLGR